MKHKVSAFLLALVMAAALAVPAFADVMWEPYDNSFYEAHRDECTYENRSYLANGQKGYVTLRTAPDSVIEVANVANGTSLYIGFIWQGNGGDKWAVGDYAVQEEGQTWKWYTGWVSMDDLALIYDSIAFEEDHGAEFQEYDGSGDDLTEAYLYSYPNGSFQMLLVEAKEYLPFADTFQNLYTDENGLRWTFVGYYMGRRDAWICIDDPLNENLGVDSPRTVAQVRNAADVVPPAEKVPDPVTSEEPFDTPEPSGNMEDDAVPTEEPSDTPEPSENTENDAVPTEELIPPAERIPAARTWLVWLIPAVLVIAVVVVTAVLIRRKNKKA